MRARYTFFVQRVLVFCAGVGIALSATRPAHAERTGVGFTFKTGPTATWIPKMPTMSTNEITIGPRSLPSRELTAGGSTTGLGWNFDTGLVLSDRYELPLFGANLYGAIGSYDTIRTTLDGSITTVRPWTTFGVDLLLPGFGFRSKHRRWMFSATARMGASIVTQNGGVAAGTQVTDVNLSASTFAVFGELEACRRIDPLSRVCLMVAPRIVGFGFMNGGTIGIRMELGR